jgi:short-subunit dehydrogenase
VATALVTGATAGIGNAFARRLAADGHALVLVARDRDRLDRVAATLHDAHGVDVEVLPADLIRPDDVTRVADRLRDPLRPVDLLVNNAGMGLRGRFVGGDLAGELAQHDLMTRAVLVLTHAAVPGMVARGRGALVTVSSVAGFMPGGTYSAAKAWATTFTVSLGLELAGTGVTATALCPGFVRTEFHERAGLDMHGLPSWAWLDADRLVRECLADVRRGRLVSVPSRRYRLAVALLRHLPPGALGRVGATRQRQRAASR